MLLLMLLPASAQSRRPVHLLQLPRQFQMLPPQPISRWCRVQRRLLLARAVQQRQLLVHSAMPAGQQQPKPERLERQQQSRDRRQRNSWLLLLPQQQDRLLLAPRQQQSRLQVLLQRAASRRQQRDRQSHLGWPTAARPQLPVLRRAAGLQERSCQMPVRQ